MKEAAPPNGRFAFDPEALSRKIPARTRQAAPARRPFATSVVSSWWLAPTTSRRRSGAGDGGYRFQEDERDTRENRCHRRGQGYRGSAQAMVSPVLQALVRERTSRPGHRSIGLQSTDELCFDGKADYGNRATAETPGALTLRWLMGDRCDPRKPGAVGRCVVRSDPDHCGSLALASHYCRGACWLQSGMTAASKFNNLM